MNSSSKPASPNSGNLTSASGYEKIGSALGGWGGGSLDGNNPSWQVRNDWTDTRPPVERNPMQPVQSVQPVSETRSDWVDTRPPIERNDPVINDFVDTRPPIEREPTNQPPVYNEPVIGDFMDTRPPSERGPVNIPGAPNLTSMPMPQIQNQPQNQLMIPGSPLISQQNLGEMLPYDPNRPRRFPVIGGSS